MWKVAGTLVRGIMVNTLTLTSNLATHLVEGSRGEARNIK